MTDKVILQSVIDCFKGDLAVIEVADEPELGNVPKKRLPRRAKEGDYLQLEIENGNIVKAKLDPEATENARKRIKDKLDRLRRGEHLHQDD